MEWWGENISISSGEFDVAVQGEEWSKAHPKNSNRGVGGSCPLEHTCSLPVATPLELSKGAHTCAIPVAMRLEKTPLPRPSIITDF